MTVVISRILTINSGSSSLKFSLFSMGQTEKLELMGALERIGLRAGFFHIRDAKGTTLNDQHLDLSDHQIALRVLFNWLKEHSPEKQIDAIGHRIVHGGSAYDSPHLIDSKLMATLKDLVPLAPDHLPHEIKAIQGVSQSYPQMQQVACFDTSFHRQMPTIAQIYPLPRSFWHAGLRRYGFHGLSYEYIIEELQKEAGREQAEGRVIVAHLGNGASMAAINHGMSKDTTMGYTPTGGLVMSTRSGDLDPGVILYLLEERGLSPASLNDLINKNSGLLGVSGVSSDMQDLLQQEEKNPHVSEAINLFCYQARKFLGGLTTVLGGLDTLVFCGGIGENAPEIRRRICDGLEFLGIRLDTHRNDENAPIISQDGAPVTVRVMHTNEELMIARHTYQLIKQD